MRAIVFDFDGTMMDTELACYKSWQSVYKEHECELPLDKWAHVVGTAYGAFNPWEYLEEQIGRPVDRAQIEARRRAQELAMIEVQDLKPGVVELMRAANEAGVRLGLATSSHRDWVERHLGRFGLLDAFESIATADDVERVKPDPALYTLAVRQLGVEPREAIAIEDSPNGALGAKGAGLACIVVPNDVTESYPFPMADARWSTLLGASLDDVRSVWANTTKPSTPPSPRNV